MKVLVTGAGGFIGRHLCLALIEQGHEVIAIDTDIAAVTPQALTIAGDLSSRQIRNAALAARPNAIVHLATVPGGAAEIDPLASRRINIDAGYDLIIEAAAALDRPRFVYASSIAVFGDPLPLHVDDQTPLSPKLIYAGHKAMVEHAVAMFSNRCEIDGVTVRLPGILARPKAPSGLKSAFMSNLFHQLMAHQSFVCPVSASGTVWVQSASSCVDNLIHALTVDTSLLPSTRAVTLPALRLSLHDLAQEVARQCGASDGLVSYEPDAELEQAFAAQPPLATPAAERAGFAHDGNCANLVKQALAALAES